MKLIFFLMCILFFSWTSDGVASCPKSFSQFSTLPQRGKEWAQNLASEIIDTRGKRIWIRKREQGQSLKGLAWLNAFLMNPIATVLDRPTQGTWLTSALGYFIFVDLTAAQLDTINEKHDLEEAKKILVENKIPGTSYIWDLIQSGFLSPSEGASAILTHEERLRTWSQADREKLSPLPRVMDLSQAGVIESTEIQPLDELMKRTLTSSTQELLAHPELAEEGFPFLLFQNFKKELSTNPLFKKKKKYELELISTAFWPSARASGQSDVELGKILESKSQSKGPTQQISKLLNQHQISIGEAYRMIDELRKDPHLIEKKAAAGASIFPQGHTSPLERPDIPRFSKELDLWRVLFQDPRFHELKNSWLKDKNSEISTLSSVQLTVKGLNQILELDQKAGENLLRTETVIDLFGFPDRPANPLFTNSKNEILLLAAKKNLSAEQIINCMKPIAEFWREFHRIEAKSVREGIAPEVLIKKRQQLRTERNQRYNEILIQCSAEES